MMLYNDIAGTQYLSGCMKQGGKNEKKGSHVYWRWELLL